MEIPTPTFWKKCSSCKKEIGFDTKYYLCSVSTCRHSRTGYRFCSVPCWDAHLGYANHREAWAEEAQSPSKEKHIAELHAAAAPTREPQRKIVTSNPSPSVPLASSPSASSTAPSSANKLGPVETLVVVSRVKEYIRQNSEMNTSECCINSLTKVIANECLRAIEKAKAAGRKTVMGRDVRDVTPQ